MTKTNMKVFVKLLLNIWKQQKNESFFKNMN